MPTEQTRSHSLKAGAAQIDITPQPGIPLTGFILREGPSTGIHDRLFARALALEAGGQQAVLIACDLLALDAAFVATARAAISAGTGVAREDIMIACTHTHSGPATVYLRDCGEVDPSYLDRLLQWLVDVAREAVSKRCDARVGAGRGQAASGAHNRRQPGTPIDNEVNVIAFRAETGQNLAVLVNYACHPVCLDHTNRLISADYPGTLTAILREQTGAVVLFTNGAAGDINPEPMGSFEYAEGLGQRLAAETLRVMAQLEFDDTAILRVAGETLDLPFGPLPTRDELDESISAHRRRLAEAEAAGDGLNVKLHKAFLGWAEETLAGALRGDLPTSIPVEIQLVFLGEIGLVCIAGEIFNQLGVEIKTSAPSRQVLVLGYANNDAGYIPTRQAYELGGYEIAEAFKFYGYPAVLAPEAGDLLLQAAARLLAWRPPSAPNDPVR